MLELNDEVEIFLNEDLPGYNKVKNVFKPFLSKKGKIININGDVCTVQYKENIRSEPPINIVKNVWDFNIVHLKKR